MAFSAADDLAQFVLDDHGVEDEQDGTMKQSSIFYRGSTRSAAPTRATASSGLLTTSSWLTRTTR